MKEQMGKILDQIVTSKEVLLILGISRARLSQLVKNHKITPIKRNIFPKEDILKRKVEQEQLREKYYRPKKTSLI